jgi:hypothetical protein
MDAEVRRTLDMAERVREFNRVHPSDDATFQSVAARLEERITRANALAEQQRAGQIDQTASNARRRDVRRSLHRGLLRLLSRVGEIAAKDQPELAQRFRLPGIHFANRAYITAAQAMVKEATASKDLFVKAGMPATLLDELAQMLALYEQATEKAVGGKRDHIGARADLDAVTAEILEVVGLLDGLNRHRFENEPEQLAAWDSVKRVIAPHRTVDEPGSPDDNGGAQTPPAGPDAPQSVAA